MNDDRPIIEYQAPNAEPIPFRPGLRALTAVAFAGAFCLGLLTFVIAKKLQLPITRMWTAYAAVASALLGVLFHKLAYRRPNGGAG